MFCLLSCGAFCVVFMCYLCATGMASLRKVRQRLNCCEAKKVFCAIFVFILHACSFVCSRSQREGVANETHL